MSVTLGYRDHRGWKSPKIISLLVSLWCSLSADANITDLLQREHPKILTQMKWPTPSRIECRRYSMANFGRMVRDSAMITTGAYTKPPSPSFHCYDRWHPTASHSLKCGPKCTIVILCRILNGHISATGDLIYFMFGSRVMFSGWADWMALFPVRSNPGWQPAAILENYSSIARFPCDSTVVLY